MIRLSSFNNINSIGVFARANEQFAVVPALSPEKFINDLAEALDVDVLKTNIAQTSLIGAMVAFNNNGIVLPTNTTSKELEFFKKLDIKTGVIDDRHTALGNLILTSDDGAIVSELFSTSAKEQISDVLDVEVEAINLHGFKTVGSIGVATSKGAVLHAALEEDELEFVEKLLKVNVDIGTVNRGIGYIRTGVVANSKGAVIGNATTSPEIARIEDALELL